MDQKQIFKQMVDFNKATFQNTFNAAVMMQDQTEKAANTILNQVTWLPEEGRKAIDEWVDAYKTGRDNYKRMVEDGFGQVESYFMSAND